MTNLWRRSALGSEVAALSNMWVFLHGTNNLTDAGKLRHKGRVWAAREVICSGGGNKVVAVTELNCDGGHLPQKNKVWRLP